MDQLQMIFTCICEPMGDFFHTIFFCCGKRFRCQICGIRFKHLSQLSRHIKDEHDEIFSFGSSDDFKRANNKLYARVITNHFNPDNTNNFISPNSTMV